MTDETKKPRRLVAARRSVALGTLAAAVAGGTQVEAAVMTAPDMAKGPGWAQLASAGGEGEAAETVTESEGEGEAASGEGGGEGEGGSAALDPETGLIRDLGFMQGHLRAGLELYGRGDREAAKTHMGHPIEEKYAAVASAMQERGLGRLETELKSLAQAAEDEAPVAEIRRLHDRVLSTTDAARAGIPAAKRLEGLIALTRVAADEYTAAVQGGKVSNLHEYQDSWGFLQVVDARLADMAEDADDATAAAVGRMRAALAATGAVYGDIHGQGAFEMDPGVIYGAAARMDLALAGMR